MGGKYRPATRTCTTIIGFGLTITAASVFHATLGLEWTYLVGSKLTLFEPRPDLLPTAVQRCGSDEYFAEIAKSFARPSSVGRVHLLKRRRQVRPMVRERLRLLF